MFRNNALNSAFPDADSGSYFTELGSRRNLKGLFYKRSTASFIRTQTADRTPIKQHRLCRPGPAGDDKETAGILPDAVREKEGGLNAPAEEINPAPASRQIVQNK